MCEGVDVTLADFPDLVVLVPLIPCCEQAVAAMWATSIAARPDGCADAIIDGKPIGTDDVDDRSTLVDESSYLCKGA